MVVYPCALFNKNGHPGGLPRWLGVHGGLPMSSLKILSMTKNVLN
jgi:hypothetical protein